MPTASAQSVKSVDGSAPLPLCPSATPSADSSLSPHPSPARRDLRCAPTSFSAVIPPGRRLVLSPPPRGAVRTDLPTRRLGDWLLEEFTAGTRLYVRMVRVGRKWATWFQLVPCDDDQLCFNFVPEPAA